MSDGHQSAQLFLPLLSQHDTYDCAIIVLLLLSANNKSKLSFISSFGYRADIAVPSNILQSLRPRFVSRDLLLSRGNLLFITSTQLLLLSSWRTTRHSDNSVDRFYLFYILKSYSFSLAERRHRRRLFLFNSSSRTRGSF